MSRWTVLPLAAGAASWHLEYGVFASLAALPAGLASFQGVTRTRVTAVAVASVGMAVSTFLGGPVAAAAAWLLVSVVIVSGYVTGLAVCLGPLASMAVAQWPVALLIARGDRRGHRQPRYRYDAVASGRVQRQMGTAGHWSCPRMTGALCVWPRTRREWSEIPGAAVGRAGGVHPAPVWRRPRWRRALSG